MTIAANNTLSFSDEHVMILDSAKEFCRDKSSIADVRALLSSDSGYDPGVWQHMVDLGWPGLAIPEAYGGSGLGIGSTIPLAECMGRNLLSTPFFTTTLAAQTLLRAGTDAQREHWLPQIAGGTVASLALLDGEDWGAPGSRATATLVGEKTQLAGEKWFVPDAGVASLFVVTVSHNSAPALVLLPAAQLPTAAIKPHTLIDETKRAARLDLTGVEVSADAVLALDKTPAALRDIELLGAALVAAEATGAAASCLDTVVEYLKTRKQFDKLIGSYQALKHPTVDMLCAMESARSLVYHAASVISDGALDEDAEIACRMAKAQATEALALAGDRAVQFHGGMGFTYECDAQLYIRRAQWTRQQFGDAAHHRKRLAPLLLDQAVSGN